jgi:diguanylate cyclase (GGDEF)-like protein
MLSDYTHNLEQKVQERTAELLASQKTAELTAQELIRSNELLKTLSDTDSLTRLYNRRFLMETLEKEMQRAQRKMANLSLVILDIDHFKRINDTHGHHNGDLVLVTAAELIHSGLRCYDTAARYGGEEFVLVLPETPHAGALLVAERLRKAVQALRFPPPMESLVVTVSIGVATFPAALIDSVDALFRQADDALYRAKHNGRNRVESMDFQG